jgi:hypothetical protein
MSSWQADGAVPSTRQGGKMSFKITFGRLLGVILVVGALTSGTAYAETAQGLKADGLRLTGIAQAYQQNRPAASFYTQQGLKADGLRLQAIADTYNRELGLRADGLRLTKMAEAYEASRPAASFYSQQALKAQGLRLTAMAKAYEDSQPVAQSVDSAGGFNWGDAGVGLAGGIAFSICAAALIFTARRGRRTRLVL